MQDITIYLPGILLAYSAFLLAIASPGPNVLAVIGTSMSVGRSCMDCNHFTRATP